jgi:hypothetical protein
MNSKESDGPSNHLIEEIKKTGYPLEIKVSCMLENAWDSITNQDTFFDRRESKLREIDICASKKPPPMGNLELETILAIECKKSNAYSWVFFTRPYVFDIDDIAGQYIDEAQMAARNTERLEIMNMILGKTSLHYQSKDKVAVTFNAFKTGSADGQYRESQNEINEAREQLKTYVDWAIDQDIRDWVSTLPYTIEMYFPCIVFRGSLFEAEVKENDEIILNPAKHLVLSNLYRSPYAIYEKNVLIDIVSEDYFVDYQKLVQEDIENLKRTIQSKAKTINRRITEIVTLLESVHKTTRTESALPTHLRDTI